MDVEMVYRNVSGLVKLSPGAVGAGRQAMGARGKGGGGAASRRHSLPWPHLRA